MNKKIAILGAGESGTGAAVLAKKQGFRIWLSDSGKIKEKYKDVLSHFEIAFEEGRHTEENLSALRFGNLNNNDWYVFSGITLTYTFGEKPCYCAE